MEEMYHLPIHPPIHYYPHPRTSTPTLGLFSVSESKEMPWEYIIIFSRDLIQREGIVLAKLTMTQHFLNGYAQNKNRLIYNLHKKLNV